MLLQPRHAILAVGCVLPTCALTPRVAPMVCNSEPRRCPGSAKRSVWRRARASAESVRLPRCAPCHPRAANTAWVRLGAMRSIKSWALVGCAARESPLPGQVHRFGLFESRWVSVAGTSVVTGASAAAAVGVARPGVWRPGCGVYRGLRLAWDVAGAGPEAVRPGRATSFGAFATGGGLGRRVIPFPFTSTFAVG